MTVTVIIPTYNRAAFLRESLPTVLGQTRPPDQVIVVDDGSIDDTEATVKRLIDGAPQVADRQYIRLDKNSGKSAALNAGLPLATGDLIWIFDDDDIASIDRLRQMVPLFERDPFVGVAHTDAVWERDGRVVRKWKAQDFLPGHMLRNQMRGNIWFTISVMFRRCLISKLSDLENRALSDTWPFDVRLERAQDYDFWIRLSWAAWRSGHAVRAFNHTTVRANDHAGRRGVGHRLFPCEVEMRTRECEKLIFEKVRTMPLVDIWPDAITPRGRQLALVDRAAAMVLHGLIDEAVNDVDAADEPELWDEETCRLALWMLHRARREAWPGLFDILQARYVRAPQAVRDAVDVYVQEQIGARHHSMAVTL